MVVRCLPVYYQQLVSYMCFTRSSMYMYPEQQVMTLSGELNLMVFIKGWSLFRGGNLIISFNS